MRKLKQQLSKKNLSVSDASLKNWKRLNVSQTEIPDKLTKRANKLYSAKNIIPVEYFKNKTNIAILNKLYSKLCAKPVRDVIYNLALNILNTEKLIRFEKDILKTDNKYLEEILYNYGGYKYDRDLINIKLPENETDILGLIYQMFLKEGIKNKTGSYYTPQKIIQKLIKNISSDFLCLDPSCGTGSFLLELSKKITNPRKLYGIDNDETACFISKINLILRFKDDVFLPNIFHTDFLSADSFGLKFDYIATNPPWGAATPDVCRQMFPEISSKESFSYFLVKSEKLLKSSGRCAFILPESILNVALHSDIRRFILDKFSIEAIELAGKVFSGVMTDSVIIYLNKNKQNKTVKIKNKNEVFYINSDIYRKNYNGNFAILNNKDAEIIDKIYSVSHDTLSQSIWGLGIVTGNNSKHIKKNGGEKIYTGKNIHPYFISDTDNYITYARENFQQTAADSIYRAKEKLVYKFISKKLIFAYDNKQKLFLNSANILIPNIKTHSVKTSLALLNSTVFQYIYKKKFNVLKILKSNLIQLPFPIISADTKLRIENMVDEYLSDASAQTVDKLDELVFELFEIDRDVIQYIRQDVECRF